MSWLTLRLSCCAGRLNAVGLEYRLSCLTSRLRSIRLNCLVVLLWHGCVVATLWLLSQYEVTSA